MPSSKPTYRLTITLASDADDPSIEWITGESVDAEDTSEDPCTDHGFDECPDCGNTGVKIGPSGYEPCARFLTCWTDR